MHSVDRSLQSELIPTLAGKPPPSELDHDVFTLPAKRKQRSTSEADDLAVLLPDDLKKAMSLARKKGASVWLTALPLQKYGFTLHKGTLHDAIALW